MPFAPAIVGTLTNGTALFGAHGVVVSGSYVYVAVQGCLSGQPCPNGNVGNSFVVIDASNPSNPTIVASLRNASLPAPWTGSGALLHACGIAVSGQYAYVTASYGNRLTIIDISDPLHPAIVGSLYSSSQLPVPVDVAVAGGYAYVANELVSNGRVAVVDVRNPASPQFVGSVAGPALNGAYRIRIRNNFAYVAATYSPSMSVIDISDPGQPAPGRQFHQQLAAQPHGRYRPRPDGALRDLDLALPLHRDADALPALPAAAGRTDRDRHDQRDRARPAPDRRQHLLHARNHHHRDNRPVYLLHQRRRLHRPLPTRRRATRPLHQPNQPILRRTRQRPTHLHRASNRRRRQHSNSHLHLDDQPEWAGGSVAAGGVGVGGVGADVDGEGGRLVGCADAERAVAAL